MAGFFTVGALAVAAERANAVGAVRLTCTWDGLDVELLRGGAYRSGFAPLAVVEEIRFTVPYRAVRGLVRHGRALCLAFDPAVVSPHNRFVLTRFTDDPGGLLGGGASHRRTLSTVAIWALPVPLGMLAAALVPSALVNGVLGSVSLAT